MTGAATIASHVVPYSTEVSLTVKNKRDSWKEKLQQVITSDRQSIWREQRDWVLANRNIEKTVDLWEQIFAGQPALVG